MVNKVTEYELKNANAVMYIPYSQKPDHGSGEAGFIYGTEPWIYADLIFGERQPEGIIQKEQARDSWSDAAQWKDLAGDQDVYKRQAHCLSAEWSRFSAQWC